MANYSISGCINAFYGEIQPLENINVVYRVLRPDETSKKVKAKGIDAKDINSPLTAIEHVQGGKKKSSWISVSTSLTNSLIWAYENRCEIAVINFKKFPKTKKVIDFRNGDPALTKRYSNYAKASAELCVEKKIPPRTIIEVISVETIQKMMTEDYAPNGVMLESFWRGIEKTKMSTKSSKNAIINRIGMLEKVANSMENWTQDFDKVFSFSQWLWTTNRKLDCLINVGF